MYVQIAIVLVMFLHSPSPAMQAEKPVIKDGTRHNEAQPTENKKKDSGFPSTAGSADAPGTPQSSAKTNTSQDDSENRAYKVKILSQPSPQDTTAFLIYVGFTALAMVVNAAILFAIVRQNKINWRQVRINARAARAASASARAATLSAEAAQTTVGSLDKQLVEMEKTANAAKENADAYAGSERAWLLVDLRPPADGPMLTQFNSRSKDEPEEESTGVMVLMICKNHGRTPALNVEPMARFEIFDEMPEEFSFENVKRFQGIIPFGAIGPGDEKKRAVWLKAPGTIAAGKRAIVYGFIKYLDIFGKERTTTFCHHVFGKVDVHAVEARGCQKLT